MSEILACTDHSVHAKNAVPVRTSDIQPSYSRMQIQRWAHSRIPLTLLATHLRKDLRRVFYNLIITVIFPPVYTVKTKI